MFKLIVVTLAAFVAVLQIFGDPARRPEVSRPAAEGFTLASLIGGAVEVEREPATPQPLMSDEEAIRLALDAGKAARGEKTVAPRNLIVKAVAEAVTDDATGTVVEPSYWYVSGNRVNLRQGPGTGNAVVAQVTLGTEAEVLDARDGWMQIVTRDGATSGWISGQFLKERKPG